MRKLTHSADDVKRGERRLSRMVPVIAGAAVLALALGAPAKSDAEVPRQVCSATVERGRMPSHTSTSRAGRLMRSPLLEPNRYLQVAMPTAYMGQVGQAASARPEPERPAFIANVMQQNVSAAIAALGSKQRATFDCAPPSSAPAPAAPAVSAPPARIQDDGAAPEQPAPRRRVIQPGAPAPSGKAQPAPKQNESTVTVAAPIPPVRKGGKGTEAEPYVIEVPVPSKRAAGSELYREKFSYTYTGESVSEKIYLSLRFVAAAGSTVTSSVRLAGQISPLASIFMKDALKAKNINETPSSGSLNSSIAMVLSHARKENPDVRAYAADS
ncbi:hypothetical protein L0Y65_06300 [Candidatus Micrarchaeota archaeon]|nr:hypothetical protein [Candidatus Micrarchaeota archaeon]